MTEAAESSGLLGPPAPIALADTGTLYTIAAEREFVQHGIVEGHSVQCLRARIMSICEPAELDFGIVEVMVPGRGWQACRDAAYLGRLAPLDDYELARKKRAKWGDIHGQVVVPGKERPVSEPPSKAPSLHQETSDSQVDDTDSRASKRTRSTPWHHVPDIIDTGVSPDLLLCYIAKRRSGQEASCLRA